jgi:hypothetical protein
MCFARTAFRVSYNLLFTVQTLGFKAYGLEFRQPRTSYACWACLRAGVPTHISRQGQSGSQCAQSAREPLHYHKHAANITSNKTQMLKGHLRGGARTHMKVLTTWGPPKHNADAPHTRNRIDRPTKLQFSHIATQPHSIHLPGYNSWKTKPALHRMGHVAAIFYYVGLFAAQDNLLHNKFTVLQLTPWRIFHAACARRCSDAK